MIVLEHRCSTVREGVRLLIQLAVTLGGFAAFFILFHRQLFRDAAGIAWIIIVLASVVSVLMIGMAIWNIRIRKEFICRITDKMVEHACPALEGETFRIEIADITRIERRRSGHGQSFSCCLWVGNESRHWLTSNYGNPVRAMIDAILQINPAIPVVDT